jgi:hypothetical protein
MNVNPTQPDPTARPGTGRLRRAPSEPTIRPLDHMAAPSVEPQKDAIEISAAAREIRSSIEAPEPGEVGLPAGRQREILGRIAQGFYQREDVRDEVLRLLAADIENGSR